MKVSPGKLLASTIKFKSDYAKYRYDVERLETWEDACRRVMDMHITYYGATITDSPILSELHNRATEAYINKRFLASQRAFQFASEPILKTHAKQYNCSASYCDRPRFFQECLWILLCGCGAGYSIQKKHVDKLPTIAKRTKGAVVHVIEDSIEGWADALGALMASYFTDGDDFQEYRGCNIKFDYSLIRPKGSYISGGFKAPGHEPLKKALEIIENLIEKALADGVEKLTPILCHDIICHSADAVLAGGLRRSALIAIFDKDDEAMLNCKTGEWWIDNAQRGRANNSAMLVRGTFTEEELNVFRDKIRQYGEPGFVIADNDDIVFNPCAEIGFTCYSPYGGETGWGFCNLNEINGSAIKTEADFLEICELAAYLGTVQAGYTDFKYLTQATKDIVEYEALLGVSITGWMDNPELLFNEKLLTRGAERIREVNKEVAEILGIRQSARTTCSKPSGNSSVLLGCSSGMKPEHSKRYFRLMRMNKSGAVINYIKDNAPSMVKEDLLSANGTDYVVYIPMTVPDTALVEGELSAVQFLNAVALAKRAWVDAGKNPGLSINEGTSHNISNTVTVQPSEWEEVFKFIYDHQEVFSGISFIQGTGDKDYYMAPFTAVPSMDDLVKKYGIGAIFASGLITDGLHIFDDLWLALNTYVQNNNTKLVGTRQQILLMKDWIKRVKEFAKKYTKGNLQETIYLLIDVNHMHLWENIQREISRLDGIGDVSFKPEYVDVDTLGAMSCYGGACEIPSK